MHKGSHVYISSLDHMYTCRQASFPAAFPKSLAFSGLRAFFCAPAHLRRCGKPVNKLVIAWPTTAYGERLAHPAARYRAPRARYETSVPALVHFAPRRERYCAVPRTIARRRLCRNRRPNALCSHRLRKARSQTTKGVNQRLAQDNAPTRQRERHPGPMRSVVLRRGAR